VVKSPPIANLQNVIANGKKTRQNTNFADNLRQWTSILLLLLLTWQTMFKAGFIIYWKANQAYITETLCENKDKPQLHCNGKCYLNKQLKKADDTESDNKSIPNAILKLKSVDLFVLQNHNWSFGSYLFSSDKSTPIYSSLNLLTGYQNSLFQPPKFI